MSPKGELTFCETLKLTKRLANFQKLVKLPKVSFLNSETIPRTSFYMRCDRYVMWYVMWRGVMPCYTWFDMWCDVGTLCNMMKSLQWRHNGCDSTSNHKPHDCLLNRLFRRWSKKTSKLRVTGLCEGNSPGTGEFPAQMASNAENVSIWWRHHVMSHEMKWLAEIIACISNKNLGFFRDVISHPWPNLNNDNCTPFMMM